LYNLVDFLPKKPDDKTLKIIMEMFEASVEGEPYDIEKWGEYYTPYGIDKITDKTSAKTVEVKTETKPVEASTVEDDVKKAEEAIADKASAVVKDDSSENKAQDILAMIRSRQK